MALDVYSNLILLFSLKDMCSPIDEKMGDSRLRWFDHVQRKAINVPEKKSELIQMKVTDKKDRRSIPIITST
jgi:hypothetical protein